MTYFTKRYHEPGTPPGTLVQVEPSERRPYTLTLMDYTAQEWTERDIASPAECKEFLERDSITWIHVQGHVDPDSMRQLGDLFSLHALALEDVLNSGQRPKLDVYEDQLFVIVNHPLMEGEKASVEQVSLFLGDGYVVSFHQGLIDPFEPVRKRLRNHSGRMRSFTADYLFYALLDVTIDLGFPVLETFGEYIEELEEEILEAQTRESLKRLHQFKRELLLLRRMLWPQREVLNTLLRDEHPLVTENTKLYLRDCYDHTIHIMDLLESYRDMMTGMLDVYLSSTSNRLNEVMRVLTVIATIFIPLTFIVGVYGMNFGVRSHSPWAMPELDWQYGYPLLWVVMITIAIGMVIYFKRRRWF
jgi:magnesium transporter